MLEFCEGLLYEITEWIILITELIGVIILAYAFVKGIVALFTPQINTKLVLADGFSLSLEFLLGGEILRTVITHDIWDIVIVAALIAIRIAVTVLLNWEIKHEQTMEQHFDASRIEK